MKDTRPFENYKNSIRKRHSVFFNKSIRRLYLIIFMPIVFSQLACTKSPPPSVSELVASSAPTFRGLISRSYTTSSSPFTLDGECDPRHYGLEYSYDNTNWQPVVPDCSSDGRFSIVVEVFSQQEVFVRAKTKLAYTPSGRAYIRLLLPPTSPFYATVTAGAARNQGQVMGIESTMPNSFSTDELDDGDVKLLTGILGVVYSE